MQNERINGRVGTYFTALSCLIVLLFLGLCLLLACNPGSTVIPTPTPLTTAQVPPVPTKVQTVEPPVSTQVPTAPAPIPTLIVSPVPTAMPTLPPPVPTAVPTK